MENDPLDERLADVLHPTFDAQSHARGGTGALRRPRPWPTPVSRAGDRPGGCGTCGPGKPGAPAAGQSVLRTSVAPDSGAVTYFTPFHGQFRTYLNGSFCCSDSGLENTARYNEGIYFQKGDALWVNLYIPSELDWRDAGAVTLNLRIPHGSPNR